MARVCEMFTFFTPGLTSGLPYVRVPDTSAACYATTFARPGRQGDSMTCRRLAMSVTRVDRSGRHLGPFPHDHSTSVARNRIFRCGRPWNTRPSVCRWAKAPTPLGGSNTQLAGCPSRKVMPLSSVRVGEGALVRGAVSRTCHRRGDYRVGFAAVRGGVQAVRGGRRSLFVA